MNPGTSCVFCRATTRFITSKCGRERLVDFASIPCHNLTSIFFNCDCRCIGRWLAERSATCPLCKIELYDDEAEESSDEEAEEPGTAAPPGDMQPSSWQQLVNLLSFNIDGGHENLVTAAANQPQPEPRQQEGPVLQQPQQQPARDILSSEPSFWRRLLLRRRGRSRRTLAEQHGVTLNSGSLAEPLLQAENGQHDITTNGDEPSAEPPRPDPPEGGETEQETV